MTQFGLTREKRCGIIIKLSNERASKKKKSEEEENGKRFEFTICLLDKTTSL